MLYHLGTDVINLKEEKDHLRSLKACFEYSFRSMDKGRIQLLYNLTIFKSPFPTIAVESICCIWIADMNFSFALKALLEGLVEPITKSPLLFKDITSTSVAFSIEITSS